MANQKAAIDTHLLRCYTQALYLGRLDHSIWQYWYTPFKVLYSSSISWPLRELHLTNQKTVRNAQVTVYSLYIVVVVVYGHAFHSKIGYALLMRTICFSICLRLIVRRIRNFFNIFYYCQFNQWLDFLFYSPPYRTYFHHSVSCPLY